MLGLIASFAHGLDASWTLRRLPISSERPSVGGLARDDSVRRLTTIRDGAKPSVSPPRQKTSAISGVRRSHNPSGRKPLRANRLDNHRASTALTILSIYSILPILRSILARNGPRLDWPSSHGAKPLAAEIGQSGHLNLLKPTLTRPLRRLLARSISEKGLDRI